jgi:ABC-type sugar transport system permease subunit
MTTSELLLNVGILAFVLRTGLGTRPLTRRRFTLPMAIVAVVALTFLRTIPTAGNDAVLDVVLGLTGLAFGLMAGGLMRVYRNPSDGSLLTKAGAPYAAIWTAVIGGRVLFAYGAQSWIAHPVANFSRGHDITGAPAWTAALVLMSLSMVLGRVAVTALRAERNHTSGHTSHISHAGAWS